MFLKQKLSRTGDGREAGLEPRPPAPFLTVCRYLNFMFPEPPISAIISIVPLNAGSSHLQRKEPRVHSGDPRRAGSVTVDSLGNPRAPRTCPAHLPRPPPPARSRRARPSLRPRPRPRPSDLREAPLRVPPPAGQPPPPAPARAARASEQARARRPQPLARPAPLAPRGPLTCHGGRAPRRRREKEAAAAPPPRTPQPSSRRGITSSFSKWHPALGTPRNDVIPLRHFRRRGGGGASGKPPAPRGAGRRPGERGRDCADAPTEPAQAALRPAPPGREASWPRGVRGPVAVGEPGLGAALKICWGPGRLSAQFWRAPADPEPQPAGPPRLRLMSARSSGGAANGERALRQEGGASEQVCTWGAPP